MALGTGKEGLLAPKLGPFSPMAFRDVLLEYKVRARSGLPGRSGGRFAATTIDLKTRTRLYAGWLAGSTCNAHRKAHRVRVGEAREGCAHGRGSGCAVRGGLAVHRFWAKGGKARKWGVVGIGQAAPRAGNRSGAAESDGSQGYGAVNGECCLASLAHVSFAPIRSGWFS